MWVPRCLVAESETWMNEWMNVDPYFLLFSDGHYIFFCSTVHINTSVYLPTYSVCFCSYQNNWYWVIDLSLPRFLLYPCVYFLYTFISLLMFYFTVRSVVKTCTCITCVKFTRRNGKTIYFFTQNISSNQDLFVSYNLKVAARYGSRAESRLLWRNIYGWGIEEEQPTEPCWWGRNPLSMKFIGGDN